MRPLAAVEPNYFVLRTGEMQTRHASCDAANKPVSAKKIAKRLAKKLGRAPTEAEIAALVAKTQMKAQKKRLN